MKPIQIAIDGPAGAGKSTIAKQLSNILNYIYIDTGAMYRAITYMVIQEKIPPENVQAIVQLTEAMDIRFEEANVYANGKLLNEEVRGLEVTQLVSHIAQIPEIRSILANIQRRIAANNNVVMDGRDIGTNVLPEATLKVFLTASVEERALRRFQELQAKGEVIDIEAVKGDIINRDQMDVERTHSPLVMAQDAIEIDTTTDSIDEVINKIISLLKDKITI